MYGMKITYYHGGFGKVVTDNVFGRIMFEDGKAVFASGGHWYAIPVEHIVTIAPIED